jgi:hypothetical protein
MRTRRRFQPMLDSMPSRIAPSAIGGVAPVLAPAVAPVNSPLVQVGVTACDTNMPETGSSTPIPPQ